MSDYDAGCRAAREGKSANDCPFAFAKVGVSQEHFEREYHHRLDAWMKGWTHERTNTCEELQKSAPKNCYTCAHIENNGTNEPGEISGWACTKREPKTIDEERQFDKNFASEVYRKRYKRCFEPQAFTQ